MNVSRGGATLASVLVTAELSRRPVRAPDYRVENVALRALGRRLVDPDSDFSLLSDLALDLCRADGFAISLLGQDPSGEWAFRWMHIAGDLAPPAYGSGPRGFSPCGVTIERGGPQLFRHPARYFAHFDEVRPPIVEVLVIPMAWNDQEEERRRVAPELHDQLGRHVAGLSLGLQTADRLDVASVAQLRQIVSEIDRDMRRIIRDLRPALLIDLGLAPAVRAYIDDWSQGSGIVTDFQSHGDQSLPAHVETTIYRIVQEALTNAARHARAQRVSVVIEQHDAHVIAIVEDDGIGFDPMTRAAAGDGRLGLVGMRERAALVGGTCAIESRSGAGTAVFVKIPLIDECLSLPH